MSLELLNAAPASSAQTPSQAEKTSFFESNQHLVSGFIGFVAMLTIAISSLALGGCSPVFNWREHRFDDHNATSLLPCKPDQAVRQVPLMPGAPDLSLHMAGCLAGGATFTVSVVNLPTGTAEAAADLALARWEAASQSALKARAGATSAAAVRGATVARMVLNRAAEAGQAGSSMSRSVYARRGLVLMQAQVLGEPDGASDGPSALSAQSVETFFGGLTL